MCQDTVLMDVVWRSAKCGSEESQEPRGGGTEEAQAVQVTYPSVDSEQHKHKQTWLTWCQAFLEKPSG